MAPTNHVHRKEFFYKGILHEYIEAPKESVSGDVSGVYIVSGASGGAREKDSETYCRDAKLLEEALAVESDNFLRSRYTFYLAQSYRDSEQIEKALVRYLERSELGYWSEEIYVSLLEAGRLMERLNRPAEEIIAIYRRAISICGTRAEAFYHISDFCFRHGMNEEGYAAAKMGSSLTEPANGLFLAKWIYDYGIFDQLALNAYWTARYGECVQVCLRLLSGDKLPSSERGRVEANAQASLEKIHEERFARNLGSRVSPNFIEQYDFYSPRESRPTETSARILVAILAKQMAEALPLYLDCINNMDYPKSLIFLYIRTNNNTDDTEIFLREWVERFGNLYAGLEFDASDVGEPVQQYGLHEWNATRFKVLGLIRNESLQRAIQHGCQFYFTADVDNFLRPNTLRELVQLNLPIVAPFLRSIEKSSFYSNFHAEIDAQGYYRHCDQYDWVLNRWLTGIIEMPVVHCTYLVRTDVIPFLTYQDGTDRHEYVIFSDSARRNNIVQYLDNRQIYGYMARDDIRNHSAQARELLVPVPTHAG
ncbi:glycosyl transferase [Methylobacterium phyllosphaerae]